MVLCSFVAIIDISEKLEASIFIPKIEAIKRWEQPTRQQDVKIHATKIHSFTDILT
jgi:hypothetical protein